MISGIYNNTEKSGSTLYLDCQVGISGDMTVAALIALNVPLEYLKAELLKIDLHNSSYTLSTAPTERHHIEALLFQVDAHDHHTHRHYAGIDAMIAESSLSQSVKDTSRKIFRCLAEAEAKVHGVQIENVHFHEVGAIDSIIDIVGTAICLDYLCVEQIFCSTLPLGSGFVKTAHGVLPVPAPATAELLKGFRLHNRCGSGERVTPTGAAIIAALCTFSDDFPEMTINKIGYGAGSKDFEDSPNILRAFLGKSQNIQANQVVEASCNLDDVTAEVIAYTSELLLERGALDVWLTPVQMKKGRPATLLSFLCYANHLKSLIILIMNETGSLGVRHHNVERTVQKRTIEVRETQFGAVHFKISETGEKAEYEDCRRIAREQNIPCRAVMQHLKSLDNSKTA